MAQIADAWLQSQERRWLRPDAHRWFRPDAERWSFDCKAEPEPRSRSQRERDWQFDIALARARNQLAAIDVLIKATRLLDLYRKYSADQPRVPAGSPEGGQWTSGAGGEDDRPSVSDTAVESVRADADHAQLGTQITYGDRVFTGIERVDETTIALTNTLARVAENIGIVPGLTAQAYGRLVHAEFATAVQLQGLRGIGFGDVETTFSLEPDAHYGSKDSIRTDVVLRNDAGDIIAIYDVKTGERGLRPSRIAELRAKTRAAPGTHIVQLHVTRGPSLKYWRIEASNLALRAW